MIFSRYGITFHFLKEEDLELVRKWRNDPVVSGNHEFRDQITPEMQRDWFKSIRNINNLYLVIEFEGQKIGVINLKNIDWDARTGEGGVFFPDPKFHQTPLPAIISYVTTEIMFVVLELNVAYAHVLKQNKSTQEFIKMLGYVLMPNQEDLNNQQYQISCESFEKHGQKLKKAMKVLLGNEETGVLCIEATELNDPLVLQWEAKIQANRFLKAIETTHLGRVYHYR